MSGRPGEPTQPPEGGPFTGLSNLQLRVISAVVLIIAVLVPTWFGGPAFRLVAIVIAGAIYFEWVQMAGFKFHHAGIFTLLGIVLVALLLNVGAPIILLMIAVGAGLAWVAENIGGKDHWGSAGFLYAGVSGTSLAFLRDEDTAGLIAILFLFAVVWATDIVAYFVGRTIGGPKLAPSISPGKTWSGAIGGALGGIAGGLTLATASGRPIGLGLAFVALLLSAVSQIGDLFESAVKRRHGVKDSSNLIPGHGGVMDRVDALVAAAFALYLIGWMLAGPDNPAHGLFPSA